MNFENRSIEARAFALPKIISPEGKNYIPVVTAMHQGRAAAGTGDEEKVPVGAGAAIAVGGADDIDRADHWKIDAHKKPDENKAFEQRVIILLDVSPSMSGEKIDLVKQKVKDLKKVLDEKHIETVLLPYDSDLRDVTTHQNGQEVIDRIQGLKTYGGTDIYKPIDKALSLTHSDKRNMVLLISDGEHYSDTTEEDILKRAKAYPERDIGIYSIGVSDEYKESLMRGVVESAGFGGLVHIPEAKNSQEVFKTLLPEFLKGVSSAPHYPIFKFNKWFDKVINLTPSMRPVAKDKGEYAAAAGYQNDAYSVAFIEEKDFDDAKVSVEVKEKANKAPFEKWDLDIEDFDEAIGLDPSERDLIKKMPLEALKVELMKKRDLDSMQSFTQRNQGTLDDQSMDSLNDATMTLRSFTEGDIDEDDLRSGLGSMDSFIGNQSMSIVLPRQGIGVDETVQAGAADYTIYMNPKDDDFEGPASVTLNPNDLDNYGKAFVLMKKRGSPALKLQNPKDADEPYKLFFKDGDRIIIGRGGELVIKSSKVSREHAEVYMEKGRLYIIDKSSRNGTSLNGGSKLKAGEKKLITDEDKIELGDATIKIVEAKKS